MSGLLGGADCGPSNALKNFSKHVDSDKSLQRDRMQNGMQQGQFREQRQMRAEDKNMMQEFYNQGRQQDMPYGFQHGRQSNASPIPANWDADFANFNVPMQEKARMEQAFRSAPRQDQQNPQWRRDFFEQQHIPAEMQGAATNSFMNAPMNYGMNMGGMGYNMGMQRSAMPMYGMNEQVAVNNKGKEKLVELSSENWEEQFKALDVQDHEERQDESQEPTQEDDFRDFESIWKDMQEENPALAEEWANEFDSSLDSQGRPDLGEYMFEPNNVYMTHANPFEEGQRLLASGGSLSEAALCFEAVCQRDGDDIQKGWSALGLCQAQNEKEEAAIKALENAVKLDPKDLQALMGLAVSYTNDGYDTAAYLSLERWLEAKYPDLVSGIQVNNNDRTEVHKTVTAQFIKAAQLSPHGAEMDADVQVGLGVLFYGDEEYDKAVDCFSAALRIRPDDALLWNRLGATLANSGKSEDAIEAYTRALDIAPTFVRCRYNLGVSCINIGCYEEAAQHLLTGLAMHQTQGDVGGGVNLSTNLWETLRRVFLVGMNRPDLSKLAVSGADVNQFRSEFEF
ncbi:hypothetical protein MRB53_042374 [Persea americana]|nr:hypothetical protein MRB53_042374 [Persea americana]